MLNEGGWVGSSNSAVGRSPPLGYRHLDDAAPAREGTREVKRSDSSPSPSPSGLMIKWIIDHWNQIDQMGNGTGVSSVVDGSGTAPYEKEALR